MCMHWKATCCGRSYLCFGDVMSEAAHLIASHASYAGFIDRYDNRSMLMLSDLIRS